MSFMLTGISETADTKVATAALAPEA